MRWLLAAFAIALCFSGVAQADDWADCSRQADLDRMIRSCSNIIAAGRENAGNLAQTYNNRAFAYGSKGDYDRVIADETDAIRLDPTLADAYYNRGDVYVRTGDYDRGIADETTVIQLIPEFAAAYADRGIAYGKKGNYDLSIADLEKAITLRPDLAAPYAYRGAAYGNKGNYDRAIADETKAIQLSPQLAFAYADRGLAFDNKGSYDRAITDLAKAIELEPDLEATVGGPLAELKKARTPQAGPPSQKLAIEPPAVATADLGHRVALVIGNSAYQNVAQLTNPTNDAKLIADALTQDGFGVTLADNLGHDGLVKALRAFATDADSADWAVVYFAGHGIEMAGINYLVPVDAKLLTDRDVDFEAVPIGQVISAIDGAHQLRMVILDACRNNPFAATLKRTAGEGRDVGRGLARIEPARGMEVVYSAKEGTIASDGDGADSPFATALAQHLTEPGVEVDKLFRLVRDDVLDATGNKQEPFVYGSLPGRQDFYFRPN